MNVTTVMSEVGAWPVEERLRLIEEVWESISRVEFGPSKGPPEATIMGQGRDVHSLSDFKERTPDFLERLKDKGEPVVLTINGKAELVVQDAGSYQKLLDLAEGARMIEGIRQGLDDMQAGRTISLDDFKDHVRKTHGISV